MLIEEGDQVHQLNWFLDIMRSKEEMCSPYEPKSLQVIGFSRLLRPKVALFGGTE